MYQYTGPVLNERYVLLKTLGDGHTAIVYKARDLRTDTDVAVKVIKKKEYLWKEKKARENVLDEVKVMQMLDHPNIIKISEFGENGKVVNGNNVNDSLTYIVMEYCEGQTLFDLWYKHGKGLGENYGRFLMHQLIDALEHMHSKGIIHRDLKPENIIVDNRMNVKLLDFGFSAYENIDELSSYRGTMTYMAPEIKKGMVYKGTEIDVFSLGVVIFSMVHGLFPFQEARRTDQWYGMISKKQFDRYFMSVDRKQTLSKEFKDLIL